jgi:hypothetical protein
MNRTCIMLAHVNMLLININYFIVLEKIEFSCVVGTVGC